MQSRLRWLFFFITLMSIVLMSARVPLDTDMWWHIKAGEVSIENGSALVRDPFSYTREGADWVNHSWLAQVLLALLFDKLGYYGLTLFVVMLSLFTFGVLYFAIKGHAFIKSLLVILGATLVSTVWSPRPQLFTLLFLSILSLLLTRYFERKINKLWVVPVLFLLWGNLHGGYFTGLLYLFMMLGGMAYDLFITKAEAQFEISQLKHLLVVTALSIPALLVNPNGVETLLIPFSTVGVDVLRNLIDEWASPDFHQPLQIGFAILLFVFVFFISTAKNKISARELFPVLGFGLLALYAKRNIAPFVIIMLPLFADLLVQWLQSLRISDYLYDLLVPSTYSLNVKDDNPLLMRIINLFLIAILGFVAAGKIIYVSYPSLVETYLEQSIPVKSYEAYAEINTSGHLLNEYGWGGYQIAKYVNMPDFVDGRTDLFGDQIIGEWLTLMRADDGYDALLHQYGITAVLLQNDRPLVSALLEKGWKMEYQDAIAILLIQSE
jgi:hypothetical protein